MFQRILVPMDGSTGADLAIATAARIAHACDGSVLLVYLSAPLAMPEQAKRGQRPALGDEQLVRAREYLQKMIVSEHLIACASEVHTTTGVVAPALLEAVQSLSADLIIVSRHGLAGLTRWGPGSLAHRLIHQCPVPLFLLPDGEQTFLTHRQIRALVALDGSSQAEMILEQVARLLAGLTRASKQQGVVFLLQVAGTPAGAGRLRNASVSPENVCLPAEQYLDAVARRFTTGDLAGYHLTASTLATTDTAVTQAIVQAAEHGPADMIAMTSHGRGKLLRWALGSIMERVLHASGKPLFVLGIDA